jgi:hypothetical protein
VDFEGSLRKWVLPSLATPLLIDDPIAIYIILRAIYLNVKFLMDMYLVLFLITILALVILLLGMKIYLLLFMVLGLCCYISL